MTKTIVAISDIHGYEIPQNLLNIIAENNYVFFLGDGISSLKDVILHKGFHGVSGNCDPSIFNEEEIIEIDGKKILITHGHKYHVKRDLLELKYRAIELGCNIVFYGHTHESSIIEESGITFINPGSLAYPVFSAQSYAYCVLNNGKLISKIVNI